ncbi:MAG: hypothetical protein ACREA7_00720 [Nitrosotalea sp.]
MSYQEREIAKDSLPKHLRVLDSDEGIRIEDKIGFVFINKTSRRYCVNISKNGIDEFFYMYNADEVLNFLATKIEPVSKIYLY